jgi:DNA-nicking Smr family endonuclease
VGARMLQVGGHDEPDDEGELAPDEITPDEIAALPIDGVLDLHTFHPRDVPDLVPTWLDECRAHGLRELRIIHGKGTGTLQRIVHAALARRRDVLEYRLAPPERGGWGATLVTLREEEPR